MRCLSEVCYPDYGLFLVRFDHSIPSSWLMNLITYMSKGDMFPVKLVMALKVNFTGIWYLYLVSPFLLPTFCEFWEILLLNFVFLLVPGSESYRKVPSALHEPE